MVLLPTALVLTATLVPFFLTNGYRQLLQQGVVLQSLDASYVSSLSIYFLITFGMYGLFEVIRYSTAQNQMITNIPDMQQQQEPFDAANVFQQEREYIDSICHTSLISSAEKRFLEMKI